MMDKDRAYKIVAQVGDTLLSVSQLPPELVQEYKVGEWAQSKLTTLGAHNPYPLFCFSNPHDALFQGKYYTTDEKAHGVVIYEAEIKTSPLHDLPYRLPTPDLYKSLRDVGWFWDNPKLWAGSTRGNPQGTVLCSRVKLLTPLFWADPKPETPYQWERVGPVPFPYTRLGGQRD